MKIALPFRFDGRLLLVGKITEQRRFAEVRARGSGSWDIFPGALRVVAGVRRPVELRLNSNGMFALSGDGEVDFSTAHSRSPARLMPANLISPSPAN